MVLVRKVGASVEGGGVDFDVGFLAFAFVEEESVCGACDVADLCCRSYARVHDVLVRGVNLRTQDWASGLTTWNLELQTATIDSHI